MAGTGGWLLPEKSLSHHFEKMHLQLTKYVEITIFFFLKPKTWWNSDTTTFFANFLIFAYISLKSGYFELCDDYDVTLTSYFKCWYLFWCECKEEAPSYTMVPIGCIWGFHFQIHRGVVTTSLGKTCYKKKSLVRRRPGGGGSSKIFVWGCPK